MPFDSSPYLDLFVSSLNVTTKRIFFRYQRFAVALGIWSLINIFLYSTLQAVADPGFPVGGGGGRQPPTRILFGKNVCENKRN